MSFKYLTADEQNKIVNAFIETSIDYDKNTRKSFMRSIDNDFVRFHLKIVSTDPQEQLISDLISLNGIERLEDGRIPLKEWLNSVENSFKMRKLSQFRVFENALRKVKQISKTNEIIIKPPELPLAEIEERIIDEIDHFQSVSFLTTGAQRVSGVAKLLVPRFENGKKISLADGIPYISFGTGWLISSNLMLTNYHVIANRDRDEENPSNEDLYSQSINSEAQFFFDEEDQEGKKFKIEELVAFNTKPEKDFALLRISSLEDEVAFLPILCEKVKLPTSIKTSEGKISKPLVVNIIQHPEGKSKKVALRNNFVYSNEYPMIHYYTDTLGGSSGSPVFDDYWRVIGLHRASVSKQTELNGKNLKYINQGIQIHSILAELNSLAKTNQNIAIALDEIKSEQNIENIF